MKPNPDSYRDWASFLSVRRGRDNSFDLGDYGDF